MFSDPEQELNLGNSGTGARLLLGLISGLGLRSVSYTHLTLPTT